MYIFICVFVYEIVFRKKVQCIVQTLLGTVFSFFRRTVGYIRRERVFYGGNCLSAISKGLITGELSLSVTVILEIRNWV